MTHYIYLFALLLAGISGVYKFRQKDLATNILAILICCAFINECAAFYMAIKYHNNLALYAIYSIIEFIMLCLYFNNVVDVFKKNNFAIFLGISGTILGILNLVFLQHLASLSSFFLLFEGVSVIGMSLFAFFRMLLKYDSLRLYTYPHFWFISIILFFWNITFLTWGLYEYITQQLLPSALNINRILEVVGIITYCAMASVFLLYPKMTRK